MHTAERYRRFARNEARGRSACFEEWADGVAGDERLLELLDGLPAPKRQPNLIFAAARFVGVEPGPYEGFRAAVLGRWPEVRAVVLAKRTQTNEPGRCAVLLPVLAALPQPLALIEVGASAGLCLFPDRYSYQYGHLPRLDPATGPGPLLRCAVTGPVPVPAALPEVVHRVGVDLNPLDVSDPEDVRWLDTLVWPGQPHRREQLAAAVEVARADPPRIVRGDLNGIVAELVEGVPAGATPVVFHSAVLAYLDDGARAAFAATMRRSAAHWVSNEGVGAVPGAGGPEGEFVLTLDERPLAHADPHGRSLHWLP